MYITKKYLSRRRFLRGVGGTAISLPFLSAMLPALAQSTQTDAASKLRFGAVYWPNGVLPELWHPGEEGRDFTFTAVMKALEPFREQLLTVNGLRHSGSPGPHLGAVCGWLNGVGAAARLGEPILSEKSLDQYFVDRYGQDTPLPSIEFGTEDMGTSIGSCDGYSCLYFNSMSWRTDNQPLPMQINPQITFERMFGESGTVEQRLQRLHAKSSLLDGVMDDLASLNKQLGTSDAQVLSNYLDNVREVERRLQLVMVRTEDSDGLAVPEVLTTPDSYEDHMALTYDLMHLAYQGDISRVLTFMTGIEASNRGYPFIGVPDAHHIVSHHGEDQATKDKYTQIVTWHVETFANFVQKLKDTPDGDGSLYDHTLLYFGSGMSNGNAHDPSNPPTVLLGGANGRLAGKGNRNLVVPQGTPTANFLLGIAELADIELEKIGPSTGRYSI